MQYKSLRGVCPKGQFAVGKPRFSPSALWVENRGQTREGAEGKRGTIHQALMQTAAKILGCPSLIRKFKMGALCLYVVPCKTKCYQGGKEKK